MSNLTPLVSFYPSANRSSRHLYPLSLTGVYDAIRTGKTGEDNKYDIKKHQEHYIRMPKDLEEDKALAKKYKAANFPAITFAGEYEDRRTGIPTSWSNLVMLDYDEFETEEKAKEFKNAAYSTDGLVLAAISVSGKGVRLVYRIGAEIQTAQDYKYVCKSLHSKCLKSIIEKIKATCHRDTSCDDPTRISYLSFDPNVLYEPSASPAILTLPRTEGSKPSKPFKGGLLADVEVLKRAIFEKWPDSDPFQAWMDVAHSLLGGIKYKQISEEDAKAIFHDWSARSDKYNREQCEEKWNKLTPPEEIRSELGVHYLTESYLSGGSIRQRASHQGIAAAVMKEHGDRILMALHEKDYYIPYILDPLTGIWSKDPTDLHALGARIAKREVEAARKLYMDNISREGYDDPKDDTAEKRAKGYKARFNLADKEFNKIANKKNYIQDALAITWKMEPDSYPKVTVCRKDQLDADLECLGFKNGVVDLRQGRLLTPAEGKLRFVTLDHTHPYLDYFDYSTFSDDTKSEMKLLFSHIRAKPVNALKEKEDDPEPLKELPPEVDKDGFTAEANFLIDSLAFSLRGNPAKRVTFLIGLSNSGKTTVINAFESGFEPWVSKPNAQLIQTNSKLNPAEDVAFGPRNRLALFDDVNDGELNTNKLKRLSGLGKMANRELWEKAGDVRAALMTASIYVACNPSSTPRLGIGDEAFASRYVEIYFPQLTEEQKNAGLRNGRGSFISQFQGSVTKYQEDMEILRCFVAFMIMRCHGTYQITKKKPNPDDPPHIIPSIRVLIELRRGVEMGDLKHFLLRIERTNYTKDIITKEALWRAWAEEKGHVLMHSDDIIDKVTRTNFLTTLYKYLPEFGEDPERSIRLPDGKFTRGRKGWKILTLEEVNESEKPQQKLI